MKILRGVIAASLLILNTAFWCPILFMIALLKLFLPIPFFRSILNIVMVGIAETWIWINKVNIGTTQDLKWDVQGLEGLSRDKSYMVIANHQSWIDIFAIQSVLNRRIPFLRFFIKWELIYVPILGLAWWALDFPMMRRYSKEKLAAHPELRNKDVETTRKSLAKMQGQSIGILNFLEGTRFTHAKHDAQGSPYKHLLNPKAGGLIFTLQSMAGKLDSIVDVTIFYPRGAMNLWHALKGELGRIVIRVKKIPIPDWVLKGNYSEDAAFRARIHDWLNGIWAEKDQLIESMS